MPWLDKIPLVSQVKSLTQAVAGDMEGARKTQEEFLRSTDQVTTC